MGRRKIIVSVDGCEMTKDTPAVVGFLYCIHSFYVLSVISYLSYATLC